ncbi:NADP-dependent oxidoreductase [Pseudonocardia sp. ICBG1293]|uniref:NADP-dependent oxidoreductase n=1 Tax=Pseudonocardia sp. ICBG1293 TaxID=2844382 RepID=UPI001CC9031F|nr:NADP-dependent oxidoreductase [Pseudonocardia sp. ICBG1293]
MSTREGRAVRFDRYGGVDELYVTGVGFDDPRPGRVLVEVHAAGINPGETAVREGVFADTWPSTFPSGQGSDWAGVVAAVGEGVTDVEPGDDVFGWTDDRASQATHVDVPAEQVLRRPAGLDAVTAGALYVAGTAAVASVASVDPQPGETVLVSGAAGGVGQIAVQLLTLRDVEVVGIASERNHARLREMAVTPVAYGDTPERTLANLRAAVPDRVHAFVDLYGGGYVALARELGIAPERINTIIDVEGARTHGAATRGTADASGRDDLAALGALVADGALEVTIADRFPLDGVRDAYTELERRHTAGKIVLLPQE